MPVTVEDLKQFLSLKNELRNHAQYIQERLARMKSAEQYPTTQLGDVSQHTTGATDAKAKAVEKRLLYTDTSNSEVLTMLQRLREIEATVNLIKDSQQRQILRYRYMDADGCRYPQWWMVAKKMYGGTDERHIRACLRVHNAALASFEKVANAAQNDNGCGL